MSQSACRSLLLPLFAINSQLLVSFWCINMCSLLLLVRQMTDARCSRCNEFKVGVRDIIQAGHGERYQVLDTFCFCTIKFLRCGPVLKKLSLLFPKMFF